MRVAIIVFAVLSLLFFAVNIPLDLVIATLPDPNARWFNMASALAEGVVAPLSTLAALALAIANRRLRLAAILAVIAPVIFLLPIIAFGIGIMIYGF